MLYETKINDSFPTMQFHIEGNCVFRLDWNEYGGGVLVDVREDIPSKLIPMKNWFFFLANYDHIFLMGDFDVNSKPFP